MLQDGRFEEAVEDLTEAVKLNPALPEAYNARGFAYFRLKRYAAAIGDFDEAIRLRPAYPNAYTNRSAARRAAGDKSGASEDEAKARTLLEPK